MTKESKRENARRKRENLERKKERTWRGRKGIIWI